MSELKKRYIEVKEKIKQSSAKAGNKPEDVRLVVVTKYVNIDLINEVINLGSFDFGENRVQDFLEKSEKIKENLNWHFIGHLQKNKVKYLLNKIKLIHSLDRISLAEEMNRLGRINNCYFNCLVQVNISGEESKYGISPKEAEKFLKGVSKFNFVKIKGLMTMAPYSKNPQDNRYVFSGLRELRDYLENLDVLEKDNLKILSMGMSNDFQVALEEGSNMVRIGSAIFKNNLGG